MTVIKNSNTTAHRPASAIAGTSIGVDDRGQSSELWCYHELTADLSGSSSAVERQLPKLDVTGSIPVSRSRFSELLQRSNLTVLSLDKLLN